MIRVAIFIAILIAVFYVFTFMSIKKNKKKTEAINTVAEYHNTVRRIREGRKNASTSVNNQITRYNSSSDYREVGSTDFKL